ncbi:aldo/keto reductase [Sphingomonas sp. Leaf357]|uniref:aldo/keto reductase n=1 Tax=Sphingomonas sp. Leaf357 TaxID=1736350 RepID=UPI0006F699CA|nr:aldo/keto reductase [Sphingomonas sp. Leaf357]KQS05073.1 aldo/keto reductase [Sphingomonas sp. Leaf357]
MSETHLTPEMRPLGKSGLLVSPIAWGMWRFAGVSPGEGRALIEAAFDAGVTLFDTADIYGFDGAGGFGDAESLLGEIFVDSPGLRDRMVLATKGGITPPVPYDSSAAYLEAALDTSLRRMKTDRVDLYQIHRPDILAHPQEVAATLEKMVASGKVRAVGVSNYTLAQTTALASYLTIPLATVQPEFSALELEPITSGLLDLTMERDIAVLAWSPLGGGRIAEPGNAREHAVAAALDKKAQDAGVSRASAAYSWIMAHPARVIPIVGTQNVGRIAEIADVHTVRWSRAEWYDVLVASRGEKLP